MNIPNVSRRAMPMSDAEKLALGILLVALVIGLLFYAGYIPVRPPAAPAQYTEDLTVKFKVYDDTSHQALTSDIYIEFYSLGVDPLSRQFTATPVSVASYDSVSGYWVAVLDAGNYIIVVQDTAASKTKYPVVMQVTVPATDDPDREVFLDPFMLHMSQRASISTSTSVFAYDESTGQWVSVSNINVTAYDEWRIRIEVSVSGTDKLFEAGRVYVSTYSGLTVTKIGLDGATPVAPGLDDDATDDGLTGYFVAFPDWKGGEIHYIDIYISETATVSAGTLTIKLADYYDCQNLDLLWWTYPSISVSVVS